MCKKIVHDFIHNTLWNDLFDVVYWIPLRRLKITRSNPTTVGELIHRECFPSEGDDKLQLLLRNKLESDDDRTLFILDGLDEVSFALDPDDDMRRIFDKLSKKTNVIISSRPHSMNMIDDFRPNLVLETIGYYPEQVQEYLKCLHQDYIKYQGRKGISKQTLFDIEAFIKSHPLIQNLVRIPILLDAICYVRDMRKLQISNSTMTSLYEAVKQQLLEKDIVRLGKKHDGKLILPQQIQSSHSREFFMKDEIEFLERLRFEGLYNQITEFNADHIEKADTGIPKMLNDTLLCLSFLRSSDNSIEPDNRTYHFIHLTYQEFFAAHHFVRQWTSSLLNPLAKTDQKKQLISDGEKSVSTQELLRLAKYSSRDDIFWRFVAGLL